MRFRSTAEQLGVDVLGELPLVAEVSGGGDGGWPYVSTTKERGTDGSGEGNLNTDEDGLGGDWKDEMKGLASRVADALGL